MLIGTLLGSELLAFQISPSIQVLTLKAGEKYTGVFELTNTDGIDMKLFPESKDWYVLPENQEFKAEQWLTFDEKELSFKNNETVNVKFNVEVPKGAQGELIGAASFTMDDGIPTNIIKKLSVVVYVAVEGTEKVKTELVAFQVAPSSSNFKAGVFLNNTGNVHVRPEGWLVVSNAKGEAVANVQILRGQPLFPGRKEAFFGSVAGLNLKPGSYSLDISMTDADRGGDIAKGVKKFTLKSDGKVELDEK